MKVVYVGVFRNASKPAVQLVHEVDLTSINYFGRKAVHEGLETIAASLSEQTRPGQRQTVIPKEDEPGAGYKFVASGRTEGVCGIAVTDHEYDDRISHGLLNKIMDDFLARYNRPAFQNAGRDSLLLPDLKTDLQKWQDPAEADNLTKIQRELDMTKVVLHNTIQATLERGQKFDDLVAKSETLSASSKMFYTQAKKQNSCCVVM